MLVFEIDEKIIKNLRTNLNKNFCKFVILNKCLELSQSTKHIKFYLNENFLCNSKYEPSEHFVSIKTISHTQIKNFSKFTTLIIDAEGFEYDYIKI